MSRSRWGPGRVSYQASLNIAARLAAADPTNAQWQRDLEYVRERIDRLRRSGN
jgi:hypothetical protein